MGSSAGARALSFAPGMMPLSALPPVPPARRTRAPFPALPGATVRVGLVGLPPHSEVAVVRDLASSFGTCSVVEADADCGAVVLDYTGPTAASVAMKGLNTVEMESGKLRAYLISSEWGVATFCEALEEGEGAANGTAEPAPESKDDKPTDEGTPTAVLELSNMVSADDLVDDNEYLDIVDDVRTECVKYGTVVGVEIPRGAEGDPGVGRIFVRYATAEEASRCCASLQGRRFEERPVVARYFDPHRFERHEW